MTQADAPPHPTFSSSAVVAVVESGTLYADSLFPTFLVLVGKMLLLPVLQLLAVSLVGGSASLGAAAFIIG